MTAPEQHEPTDDALDRAADADPDRAEGDGDVVLTTDEDEQRDDLPVQPGNS